MATNCVDKLAKGLKKAFAQYKNIVLASLIERTKEKKSSVIEALSSCLDSIFCSILNIGEILSDVYNGLNHKNPQVKLETIRWFIRCVKNKSLSRKDVIPKGEVKNLVENLLKCMDDGLEAIRDNSAEALGILIGVLTERVMNPYLERLDKVKLNKVQEYAIAKPKGLAPVPDLKRPSPPSPTIKKTPSSVAITKSKNSIAKSKAPSKTSLVSREASTSSVAVPDSSSIRYEFSDDSAKDYVSEKWPGILEQLSDSNWKIRLEAIVNLHEKIKEDLNIKLEAIIKCLLTKPGWKETNFQVSAGMCNIFVTMSESKSFDAGCAFLITSGLINKLGDVKVKKIAGACLEKIAAATSLELVFSESYETLKKQKSPKIYADSLLWMNATLMDFGVSGMNVKSLVQFLKFSLTNTNSNVRSYSVAILATLRRFSGSVVRDWLNDVNPAILSTIDSEFEKVSNLSPPVPVKQSSKVPAIITENISHKVDISSKISPELIKQMGDVNWKERKAAIDNILQIIESTGYKIQPSLPSEFLISLKARLGDSNKNLASSSVDICGFLSVSIGKPFERHLRNLIPAILAQLCDQKSTVRQTVIANLDKIFNTLGLSVLLPYITTALVNENPYSRKELLQWTFEHFESTEKVDYNSLILPTLTCVQDRNAELRKLAQLLLTKLSEKIPFSQIESTASDSYRGTALATVMTVLELLRKDLSGSGASEVPGQKVDEKSPVKEEESKKGLKKPKLVASSSVQSLKKEVSSPESAEPCLPFISTDLKPKDCRANADRGVLKWAFENPRRELIDMLYDQASSNLSAEVCNLLFSTDHYKEKDFLAGLKLIDDFLISDDIERTLLHRLCIANCDIVLKYLTIRFFDTNTTILIKCLDVLEHFLSVLDNAGYFLNEYEVSCFMPFFIQKLGDPKETLRVKLRLIIKQFSRVYPSSKLFLFVLKGIDSKNSRTRTECLDEIASLLQRNGGAVFNPAKALPIIVSQVSDRDSSVRNASLGAICQAYLIMGEDIYNYMGRLSEKDKGIISERIRRLPTNIGNSMSTDSKTESFTRSLLENARKDLTKSIPITKLTTPHKQESSRQSTPVKIDIKSVPKQFSLDFETLDISAPSQVGFKTPINSLSRPDSRNESLKKSTESVSEDRLDLLIDMVISKVSMDLNNSRSKQAQ